jgi:hypothetical protein
MRGTAPPPPPSEVEAKSDEASGGGRRENALATLFKGIRRSARTTADAFLSIMALGRAHFALLIIFAVVFASVDIVAVISGKAGATAPSFSVFHWDRAFMALMLFAAIDLGALLAIVRAKSALQPYQFKAFDYAVAIKQTAYDALRIMLVLAIPAIVRFAFAMPTASPEGFPLASIDLFAILLTGVFLVWWASAIGALVSQLLSLFGARARTGRDAVAYRRCGRALAAFLCAMLAIAAMVVLAAHTGSHTTNPVRMTLAAFSADGVIALSRHFRATDADISIPSGYYRLAALLKTALFVTFIQTAILFAAVTLHGIGGFARARADARRRARVDRGGAIDAADRGCSNANAVSPLLLFAIPAAFVVFSTAAFILIDAEPFAGGRNPAGEFEYGIAGLFALAGAGLALSLAWVYAKWLAFRETADAEQSSSHKPRIGEFAWVYAVFAAPAFVLLAELSLVGVVPKLGATELIGLFAIFTAIGFAIACIGLLIGRWFARYGAAAAHIAVFIVCSMALAIASAGGYGTLSAGSSAWQAINPFVAADRLAGLVGSIRGIVLPIAVVISVVLSAALAVFCSKLLLYRFNTGNEGMARQNRE